MKKLPKKILIIRFGAIGDVVHSTELFRAIKRLEPDTEIHYLSFKAPSMLIQNDPDLKKVWIAEGKKYSQLFNLAKELKKEKFDLILNLQPSNRTKFLIFFAGAKKVLTYKKTFKLHAVENFWRTAKPAFKKLELSGELKIHLPKETLEKADSIILKDKKTVGFNIGTSITRQGRRWPISYWRELAKSLIEKYDCEIVLTGSEEDKELTNQLIDVSPSIKQLCGELSLRESAAVLSKCDLVISSDTGPLHIATAVGTTCIGIYGAAPISRTGPYGEKHFAISSQRTCVPCNKRKCKYVKKNGKTEPCILDLIPERLIAIIEENSLLK